MADDDLLAQILLVDFDLARRACAALRAAVDARHLAAIEFVHQLLLVGRDEIDQVFVERFPLGERLALADGFFGQFGCCARA